MVSVPHVGIPPIDRAILLGPGACKIPEKLLLAHASGKVLFITGAGTSMPSGFPDFKKLVLDVYSKVDAATYAVLNKTASESTLRADQRAEAVRFDRGDFDVVLGMLERRSDGEDAEITGVRLEIDNILRNPKIKPHAIHRDLIRLADRGEAAAIATTNFDRLLDQAARGLKIPLECYSLGAIPRPSTKKTFAGIFHIHGLLPDKPGRQADLILSDRDFGEFYLRRRVVPDFIYDAARLYHLVLVGYSANDAPMRYLLNAVAADGNRFSDLKTRYAFVAKPNANADVEMEDWRGRGMTPIPYDAAGGHSALSTTLKHWAALSAVNGNARHLDVVLKRIMKQSRAKSTDDDRDLFDHLVRRASDAERVRISSLIPTSDWLTAHLAVTLEPRND